MDIDTAGELVNLGRTLSRWKFNWDKIWSDAITRMNVAQIAGAWSERVQTMSGKYPPQSSKGQA
ncbi:MAG: hypothetical protein KME46_21500 [Brasilonema angustatum HA4187-MV1]|jgi:hypothetical protein|nr:hypothetical protein [Brasilonema angustatum HA4187-MV1]